MDSNSQFVAKYKIFLFVNSQNNKLKKKISNNNNLKKIAKVVTASKVKDVSLQKGLLLGLVLFLIWF